LVVVPVLSVAVTTSLILMPHTAAPKSRLLSTRRSAGARAASTVAPASTVIAASRLRVVISDGLTTATARSSSPKTRPESGRCIVVDEESQPRSSTNTGVRRHMGRAS
jgi:hypothetical protein